MKQKFRDLGIYIKKKHILKGAVIKLGTTIITFGHDDLVPFLETSGSIAKKFAKRIFGISVPRGIVSEVEDIEKKRTDNSVIKKTTTWAGAPTSWAQKELGVHGASDVGPKHNGWSDSRADVAKEVFLVGAV